MFIGGGVPKPDQVVVEVVDVEVDVEVDVDVEVEVEVVEVEEVEVEVVEVDVVMPGDIGVGGGGIGLGGGAGYFSPLLPLSSLGIPSRQIKMPQCLIIFRPSTLLGSSPAIHCIQIKF